MVLTRRWKTGSFLLFLILVLQHATLVGAKEDRYHDPTISLQTQRTWGQIVYVPVYSHIFFGDVETPFLLAATVMVRNTDRQRTILVCSADYYDSDGKLLQRFLPDPIRLPPLATTRFIIPESDTTGGAGASVLVMWKAAVPVTPPLLESVMIGTRNQQGISFTSRGQVLDVATVAASGDSPSLASETAQPSRP